MLELSRGLGDFDFCRAGYSQQPHVAGPLVLREGDAVLLASDGVWDVFEDAEAGEFVRTRLASEDEPTADLSEICRALTQQAAARGSRDDKTAVLVVVGRRAAAAQGAEPAKKCAKTDVSESA